MLATVPLAAILFFAPKPSGTVPARAACPNTPQTSFTTTERSCPALEISGRSEGSEGSLDAAFDVTASPAELARPGRGDAMLTGFAADGRTVFAMPLQASGPFHLFVPLAPALAQSLQRVVLTTASSAVERTATTHGEPDAEAIAIDDSHILVAWNAHAFPAIRVTNAPASAPATYVTGTSTYEQFTFASTSRRITIAFSDGVRSTTRAFRIFGR